MDQLALHIDVSTAEISRKPTLGKAIELCADLGPLNHKLLQDKLGVDKAQWSRWISGQEGIKWERLHKLIDICGNDVPVLWMVQALGYDLTAMRRIETTLERENRLLREQNAALLRVLRGN